MFPEMAAAATATINNIPVGIFVYWVGTLAICKPNFINPITIVATAVPKIDPFPPVMAVPPRTTAVIIERVVSAPKSERDEFRYELSRIPAREADIPTKTYVEAVISLALSPE